MKLHSHFKGTGANHSVWLYSLVFTKKLSMMVVLFMYVSFFIQPIHQALANEALPTEETEIVIPDEVSEQLPDAAPETRESTEEDVENVDGTAVEPEGDELSLETDQAASINDTIEPLEDVTDTVSTETKEASEVDISETNNLTNEESATTTNDGNGQESKDTATSSDEVVKDQETNTNESIDNGGQNFEDTASTTKDTATDGTASSTHEVTDDSSVATSTASSTDPEVAVDDTTSSITSNDNSDINTTVTDNQTNSDNEQPAGGNSDVPNNNIDNADEISNTVTTDEDTTSEDFIDSEAIQESVTNMVDGVVDEVVTLTRQLVNDENYYQFSKQSCVAVGDGTYHCTNQEPTAIDPDSAVYAEADAGGDMEIFLRTSQGDIKQLTDNDYDDTSPDVDLASMRVVWQRLIDGRYQIITYDLNEREETQLTFSKNNSMEPKVSIDGIVWQAWDGTDWEVMFFDGQYTDQITNNDGIQDVTPVIEDGYILWSVLGGEESEARVYSLESGERMTIMGHEGGTVANPRFVLVYDTKFENGDLVTIGFDPVTGLAEPVSSKPADLPYDIPEPDPVGEIRALIQNKSTQKDQEIVTVPTAESDGDLDLASTSDEKVGTLFIDNPLDAEADLATTSDQAPLELTEFDLIITDTASSAPSVINPELINAPQATNTESITISTQE